MTESSGDYKNLCSVHRNLPEFVVSPFKDGAQTTLFKDPVRTAQ